SSRRRHTRLQGDWSSDVCSSDLSGPAPAAGLLSAGSSFTTPGATLTSTCRAENFPYPSAAYRSSILLYPYSPATFSNSDLATLPNGTPRRRASLSRYFWPISIAFTRSLALTRCRILLRARGVLTKASQSLLGPWP